MKQLYSYLTTEIEPLLAFSEAINMRNLFFIQDTLPTYKLYVFFVVSFFTVNKSDMIFE